jgi:hypothetical protein
MAGGSVTFQAQNPARSGDKSTFIDAKGKRRLVGWTNCTAFVAAMGAEFDAGIRLTGTQVRHESNEPVPDPNSPGLSLSQVGSVLRHHGVTIGVETPIDFDDLDDLRESGHAIGLQLSYRPIQNTAFSGDRAFKDGHIVLWLPNGDVYDPLDDHRRSDIAQAPVRIPTHLLREAAGGLVLIRATGRTVGIGRAFAAVFPTRHPANQAGGPAAVAAVMPPPVLTFGSEPIGRGEYAVSVAVALIRARPGGVPGRANMVGRRQRGSRVRVFGSKRRGQQVGGSRLWHQVNRAGTQFMHSSVIDPVD